MVDIWGSLYYLDDSKVMIYQKKNGTHCVKKEKTKADFHQYDGEIGGLENGVPPIYITLSDKYIELYICESLNLVFTNLIGLNMSKSINCGLNRISLDSIEKDKPYSTIFIKIKDCSTIPITMRSTNNDESESNSYSEKDKNNMMATYQSHTNDDSDSISKAEKIRDFLHKDPEAIDINEGGSRTAFKVNNPDKHNFLYENDGCIVKVVSRDDNNDNRMEFQTWQAVKGTQYEKYFCPIRNTSPNYSFIIMESVDIDSANNIEHTMEIKSNIREIINRSEIPNRGFDIHSKNIGYHAKRDRAVLVDYPYGANFQPQS